MVTCIWVLIPVLGILCGDAGFILLFIGIALTVSYYLTRELKKG